MTKTSVQETTPNYHTAPLWQRQMQWKIVDDFHHVLRLPLSLRGICHEGVIHRPLSMALEKFEMTLSMIEGPKEASELVIRCDVQRSVRPGVGSMELIAIER